MINITFQIIEQAKLLLGHHVLRAYDAIQLASAIIANQVLVKANLSPLIFLATDDRLLKASQAEGIESDNPINHA